MLQITSLEGTIENVSYNIYVSQKQYFQYFVPQGRHFCCKKISEQPLPTVQMQTQHDAPDVTEGALQVESSSHYITTTSQGVSGSRLQINAHVPFFGY